MENLELKEDNLIKAIETLRVVLGTMVMKPVFRNNPTEIGGEKILVSNHQHPIVEGSDRTKVESKLMELINKLK